ncbi:phosphate ABC transporter, inner membrane subunit PstC [Thermoclostridium stercorarium subsp. stercorarium DSM 8532]|uniref:Phosphate transport system permease protein n=3 Tax=Thermoclostridium stercorarium TaxID=1510 RepID=L7VR97_THES1|nr:phosphate ABC transporter permease subunit PstC [Thermoclostridium stercorarium]AGC69179.1 phosphate ABC transporter, inner membrane subunit PstC [Thermoclostridium stercorarium subsp. stercorarium DSM 8532]AGI40150.1 ABC transporter periplasmic subunit [Thermoclostridium stercorarium subsp. stercorarium DSM 8532]ANW99457.1 phosphate ABC transporter permease subunit PstC [Thermoclostridium stercorarium subsp. thermolacticum DSM 2910]ANX02083.1 phosphate ABC transporter permease subunit PstC 
MKKNHEKVYEILFMLAACTSVICVALICLFLFSSGIPAIVKIGAKEFLSGTEWKPGDTPPSFGVLPMILGSIIVTAGAIIIGAPVGVFTAVFLAKFCPGRVLKLLKPAIDLLAGIPSVVYGFFGIVALVPLVRNIFGGNGYSMLTASILLGIMTLPTIISVSTEAINAVPESFYEGSLALGASHERSVFFTVLPAAKSGITASIILGTGRAIGETMAVIMVSGNQARMPAGLLKGIRTLTANIVIEMGYAAELHREALFASGVVLFVFILLINILFLLLKRGNKQW